MFDFFLYGEVYFLDDGNQLKRRLENLQRYLKTKKPNQTTRKKTKKLTEDAALYKEIVTDLQKLLMKENYYVQNFKKAHKVLGDKQLNNCKIVFHTKQPNNLSHHKVYDAPTIHEVAAILPEDDVRTWNARCVIVYLKDTDTRRAQLK